MPDLLLLHVRERVEENIGGGLEAVNLRSMVGRGGEGEIWGGGSTCASHVTPSLCEDSQP